MKKVLLSVSLLGCFVFVMLVSNAEDKTSFQKMIANKKANPINKSQLKSSSDAFGYQWNEGTYSWQDISSTGTNLVPGIDGDDEHFGPFNLGFDFPFYGNLFSQFYFSTNGTIYFEDEYLGLNYQNIPATNGYNVERFIAWHWTDLGMYSSINAAVYYQDFGDYGIIQFNNYCDYDDDSYSATMQVVLHTNGNIELRYNNITLGYDYDEYFAVGIQENSTTGMEIAYDDDSFFSNNKSIMINHPANAVPISKLSVLIIFLIIGTLTIVRFFKS